MRNPHGNLICPHHGAEWIKNDGEPRSGPWGVTCGYWHCSDQRCCLRDGDPKNYPMEAKQAP